MYFSTRHVHSLFTNLFTTFDQIANLRVFLLVFFRQYILERILFEYYSSLRISTHLESLFFYPMNQISIVFFINTWIHISHHCYTLSLLLNDTMLKYYPYQEINTIRTQHLCAISNSHKNFPYSV